MSTMSINIAKVAKEWLTLRESLEQLELQKASLEATLKEFFQTTGEDAYVHNGTKIAYVEGERAKYDTEALRDLVSPATFKKVIKTEVDGKKFKGALELGLITSEVAEAITTITEYTQLRVTEVKGAVSAPAKKKKATAKVA
jgi:hypothetical protein